MPQSLTRKFLLAIETDATRYHGANASRPHLLEKSECGQMLAHVAADLTALLPIAGQCKLVAVGALFDQTQVLRPGYPVFAALEHLLAQSTEPLKPGQLCLAAENDRMPLADLQPEAEIPLGLLLLLPLLVSGPRKSIDQLGTEMEHRFLGEGQVSAHTANWLESAFAIKINHARFMTLMDLNAMFRLQLEHFGFLPLWQLIDAALNARAGCIEVVLDDGQLYTWRDGAVHTQYQTFDYWARSGGGRSVENLAGKLAGGYADWTRTMRQFLTVLQAHNVRLEFNLPEQPEQRLRGNFFIETDERDVGYRCAAVTEHSFGDLGTVCVSVVTGGHQENYYPLRPQGLNDIHYVIRERGLGASTISFPGSILVDEKSRTLVAEPLKDSQC